MGETVDTETLTMLRDVMEDDFGALITTFLDDAQERIPQMAQLLESADADGLRHAAHSLKGSSSNLGALPLSQLCFEVEHRAKQQQLSDIKPFIGQIDAEFQQVKDILLGLL